MRYPSTLPGLQLRILEYSDAMFFYNFLDFFFSLLNFLDFFLDFFFFFATTIPLEQYPSSVAENACNFTSSCSWRRRFNNNNSKQCCFKNQRWQNNPFDLQVQTEIQTFGPSFWVVSLTVLELGNIFTNGTMPAAAAHPGTGKRRPRQIFFFFFFCIAAEYSGMRNRTMSSYQPCGYSSIRLHVAALCIYR